MARRFTRGWITALGLGLALAGPAARAAPLGARHPHFDDRGTLAWSADARSAYAAAAAERRLVLAVVGRPDDPATAELVTRVLPDPQVATRVRALCVGLALDSRAPQPAVDSLLREALGLSSATPAVAFLTCDGRWITGFRGTATLPRFLQHLALAESRRPSGPALRGDDAALPPPRQRVVAFGAARAAPPATAPATSGARGEDPRLSSIIVRLDAPGAAARPAAAAATGVVAGAATAQERAREARAGLDRALALVLAHRRDEAVATLRGVCTRAAGLPEAAEAARGIDAIQTAADLERLSDPQGVLATSLRRTKRDELRGTRWARLFAG